MTCRNPCDLDAIVADIGQLRQTLLRDLIEEVIRAPKVQGAAKAFFSKVGRKLREISPYKSKRVRTMTDSPSLEPQAPVLTPSIDCLRAKEVLKDTIKAETRALQGSDQVDYGHFVEVKGDT